MLYPDRRVVAAALALILVVLVLLRVFNVGHTLTYDEAWNVNSVIDAATGQAEDVFYSNFLRHPPVYSGLSALYALATGAGRHGLALAMQVMSLVFAAGAALALFFCGRDWFGDGPGLAAAFLFAVMPAARMYDSLAKPESLTVLFGLLFLLFFFRGRYLLGGAFLGLAMLTKEIFIFVPAAVLLFLLASRQTERLKGFAVSLGAGVAMSAWWYLLVSNSKGEFLRFFLGRSREAVNWREPFWFYLSRLPDDVGWPVLALCLAGVVFLSLRLKEGWPGGGALPGAGGGRRPGWEMALLAVLWLVFAYAFLSLSYGKPPWLVYSAMPAFALLGGWGLSEAAGALRTRSRAAPWLVAVSLACALALSVPVGFGGFLMSADRTYPVSVAHRGAAEYVNAGSPGRVGIMMPVRDFSPNIAFYLDSYSPNSVHLLPREPVEDAERDLPEELTVLLYDSATVPSRVAEHLAYTSPGFLVMRPGFPAADGTDPAVALSEAARPVEIDGTWVFDAEELYRALSGAGNR